MLPVSATSVRVRPVSFEDHPGIAHLMEMYKLETKPAEEWRHLWESNPEFVRVGDDWPIGWLLEDARDHIIGYVGNIPVAYEFRGKRLIAAATHAWVVDAAHRRSTIALVHRYFSQKNVDLFIDTSANYEAGKIFEAMHGHRIPSPGSDIALFWVTDHPRFVSSLMKQKGLSDAAVPRYLVAGLMWGATETIRHWRGLWSSSGCSGGHIQLLTQFDERFDDFWERLRSARDVIMCVRDRQTLTWHFRHALARGEAWIFVASEGSSICAYSIFLR